MAQKKPSGEPIDLANMRHNGVRGLLVSCRSCHGARVVNMDAYNGSLTVPSFGPRMVCQACGSAASPLFTLRVVE
jgi:hypothetical protein